ncbi:MAG: UDP-3-O-(3-hydroxymyristoyl)glucosamine N-acyltransferase, partial [Deltaproteobacteria bacterium]|nr:UDP-3-O-(3-hydroxymyristoyl)glucosamine N-acyltransferase [Deltaproteobacteria bacterium]
MKTLEEIAQLLQGELKGPPEFNTRGIQSLTAAGPDEISFAVGSHFKEEVEQSKAGALILPKDWPYVLDRPSILVKDPYLAYALIATAFLDKP